MNPCCAVVGSFIPPFVENANASWALLALLVDGEFLGACGSYLSCIALHFSSYGENDNAAFYYLSFFFCEFGFFWGGGRGFGDWFGSLGETKIWIFVVSWYLYFLDDDMYVCYESLLFLFCCRGFAVRWFRVKNGGRGAGGVGFCELEEGRRLYV